MSREQSARPTTTQLMIAAFVVAAPLGVALGFLSLAILPPEFIGRVYAAFFVLILLGGLGIALFAFPAHRKGEAKPAVEPPSNVIRFEQPARRATRPVVTGATPVTALRFRKATK